MANPVDSEPDQTASPDKDRLIIRWGLFIGLGLVLYLAIYSWAEVLARETGGSNRFFQIATAPLDHYDTVILGASHAMPLGFGDMAEALEVRSGTSIMNLSIEGGGIVPAHFLLEYFLAKHTADQVVVFVDSFAFYSEQWNEVRLNDPSLFRRAPLDLTLAALMWRHAYTRDILPAYLSGFLKINDSDRFVPEVAAGASKFESVYRPNPQIDRQRIAFLYPESIDATVLTEYLDAFADLIERAEAAGARVVLVKPPTPERYRINLPDEAAFDAAVAEIAAEREVVYHDFSETILGDEFYYDTDHLNRQGVELFAVQDLLEILGQT